METYFEVTNSETAGTIRSSDFYRIRALGNVRCVSDGDVMMT